MRKRWRSGFGGRIMEMTGEALIARTRVLVRSLRDLTVRDAATVLIMGLACLASARAKDTSVEDYGEQMKQTLIEQIKRLDDRG